MSEPLRICVDVYPPGFSPADNPDVLAALRSGVGKAAIVNAKKWSDRTTLHVRFLDGDPAIWKKVEHFARQWCDYANIKLVFDNAPNAEIRISFRYAGSWSYVGNDALDENIAPDQPTMNFGWLTTSTPNDEVSRVVIHEFGHALGLIHEHQNPAAAIPWNKPAVYDYYGGPPNNWTHEQTEMNLFMLYSAELTSHSSFDPESIMLYPIPAAFLTEPGRAVGWNRTLSAIDKAFIATWYPPAAPITVTQPEGAIAEPGDENSHTLTVTQAGDYEILVESETDMFATLRAASGALLARDDDSGPGDDPLIRLALDVGVYILRVRCNRRDQTGSYTIKATAHEIPTQHG